jgi:aspartate aminotransferase-like enzyme
MEAMVRPIINHRGNQFHTLLASLREGGKKLFQTNGEVLFLTSSGTAGVDAAVLGLIRPGDKAIVTVFGEFGERLAETVEVVGGSAIRVESPYGTSPNMEQGKKAMDEAKDIRAVFILHNETSTGTVFRYTQETARLSRERGAYTVVDAISSLGGYAIPVDAWGVDICVTGSQKCIAAPPGVSLVSVSDTTLAEMKKNARRTRYFDLPKYVEYAHRGETPYTPAIPLFYALDESLKMLVEEGLDKRVARHERLSRDLYGGLGGMGLEFFSAEGHRSNTVIAAKYPNGVDDKIFRSSLDDEHDIVIAGGFGNLVGKIFRIGCMGEVSEEHISRTLAGIGITLNKLGVAVDLKSALKNVPYASG